MRIVVIIPTYNEAENLLKLVSALFALPLDLNILVVDDNSPDGTGRIADDLAAANPKRVRVMHRTGKLGLSSAYLQAFHTLLDNTVDVIGQMDADFSHDPAALVEMVKRLETCDLVLGSRYIPGGSTDVRWPIWRKALSAWGNFYARSILRIPLRDVTGGFRLWRRETLQTMPLERVKASGYIFLVEMAYLAWCLQFKIGEVPIYFADRRWGKTKMSFKIQAEAAMRVWQVLWAYRDLRHAGQRARVGNKVS
ncbi:MAG: polyprenol monophosphomannose synthase [Chloroflexi bacterium]|nr:polyprenol monophosphomannose synthase [Chloroflexota bacterium]